VLIVLFRQNHLNEFGGDADDANQTHCAPEIEPRRSQMIARTDNPDAMKEDAPYGFALGRYHGYERKHKSGQFMRPGF
jgi:hypothetical protein